LVVFAKQSK